MPFVVIFTELGHFALKILVRKSLFCSELKHKNIQTPKIFILFFIFFIFFLLNLLLHKLAQNKSAPNLHQPKISPKHFPLSQFRPHR